MTASGGMHTLDIAYLHHVDSFRMGLFAPRSSRIFKKNPSTKIPQLGRSILLVNRQSIMVKKSHFASPLNVTEMGFEKQFSGPGP